jgi:class 3 adenylate cyclase
MDRFVTATMLFADLMNSTEMAKILTLEEYDQMIVDFQTTMYEVATDHLRQFGYAGNGEDSEWSIVGDEIRVFLYSGAQRFDVRNALLIALKIKLGWLVSDFNQKILKEGRLVSRVGVGINCGKVIRDIRPWRVKHGFAQPNVEGYAINLTKRIESSTRGSQGYQVMVGDSFWRMCGNLLNVDFSPPQSQTFKGLGQNITIYEVIAFIDHEIVSTMPLSMQQDLVQKMEYAVSQPMPEPWTFYTLIRHYISEMVTSRSENAEAKAIRLAREALDSLAHKRPMYNTLGWLHTYGKNFRDLDLAFKYFNNSLELNPGDSKALLHLARIAEMTGHKDLSRRTYEEILIYNPDHPEARRKMNQFKPLQMQGVSSS